MMKSNLKKKHTDKKKFGEFDHFFLEEQKINFTLCS